MIEISSTEKTTIRTLSIHIVRSIAELHGGTIEKNPLTDTIEISVPVDKRDVCTSEICEQLEAISEYFFTLLLAYFSGKILVRISNN